MHLQHIGYMIPPQADCGWIGEAVLVQVMEILNGTAKKLILQWAMIMISPTAMQLLWHGILCIQHECLKIMEVFQQLAIRQKTGSM